MEKCRLNFVLVTGFNNGIFSFSVLDAILIWYKLSEERDQ
jgi:hypothetical protein